MGKIVFGLIFFVAISHFGFCQQWLDSLPKKSKAELTFYDYQRAFYSYWKPFDVQNGYYTVDGKKIKAAGWKQFKRWEYDMQFQIDKKTGKVSNLNFGLQQEKAKNVKSASWISLGMNSSDGGYHGIGRINCVAFHPSDNNTYWVGSAGGGVWKTTNNGNSWICLTDDQPHLSVSSICVPLDYETSHTLYYSTGSPRQMGNGSSTGVFKSTDGGVTWNTTGLSYSITDGVVIYKLLLNPLNDSQIYAVTSSGLYKSDNEGAVWNQLSSNSMIDMEFKPGNASIMYCSSDEGKIYKSTNSGISWSTVFNNGNSGRIELAVSADEPTWVYAVGGSGALDGIYKSTDNGSSFGVIFSGSTKNLFGFDAFGADQSGMGWYASSIAVSPSDANIVQVGSVNGWRSTDGGATFQIINHYAGTTVQAVHADKQMLIYRTDGTLFECNDGGIYISSNNGTNWIDKTNGMAINQIYRIAVSQLSNETITGSQDNGSSLSRDNIWESVSGGDGTDCAINFSDPLNQYSSNQYGQFYCTTNGWESHYVLENPYAGEGSWITPIAIHPEYPNQIFLGYSNLLRSITSGLSSWVELGGIDSDNGINCIQISKKNPQVMYISDWENIWRSNDGGNSWVLKNGNLPLSVNSIVSIAVKKDDENTVWIAMGGFNNQKIFKTTDGGTSWVDISNGLPAMPVYSIVQNEQSIGSEQLYVGTYRGVYFKDGTNDWEAFNTGLPLLQVNDLEMYYHPVDVSKSRLRAGTFGRGLWETKMEDPNIPYKVGTSEPDTTICKGTSTILTLENVSSSQTIQWQKSITGYSEWTNLLSGTGAVANNLNTGNMTTDRYFRAIITQNGTSVITLPLKVKVVDCASLSEISENRCKVYPNPSSEFFTILSDEGPIENVALYSIKGDVVLAKRNINKNQLELNVAHLESGNYTLEIERKSKKETITISILH